jgi:surfeit locus 1 family protein
MKPFKLRLFVGAAILSAALFVRLGIWQLHRREERRARNAMIAARLDSAEVDVTALPRDTARVRFRRVRVRGIADYEHELVWAARSYKGSPGVNLLTPVRVPGRDTAIIVDRGWVYTPDGATVDLAKWHDRDSVFSGFVEDLPARGGASYASRPRVIARLAYDVVGRSLPYPVSPFYVVALGDSTIAPDRLARLRVPALDEGPHLSYAIQWFSFAIIALVGAAVVIRQPRPDEIRTEAQRGPHAPHAPTS